MVGHFERARVESASADRRHVRDVDAGLWELGMIILAYFSIFMP